MSSSGAIPPLDNLANEPPTLPPTNRATPRKASPNAASPSQVWTLNCPHCGRPFEVEDRQLEQTIPCPHCQKELKTPSRQALTAQAAAMPPASAPIPTLAPRREVPTPIAPPKTANPITANPIKAPPISSPPLDAETVAPPVMKTPTEPVTIPAVRPMPAESNLLPAHGQAESKQPHPPEALKTQQDVVRKKKKRVRKGRAAKNEAKLSPADAESTQSPTDSISASADLLPPTSAANDAPHPQRNMPSADTHLISDDSDSGKSETSSTVEQSLALDAPDDDLLPPTVKSSTAFGSGESTSPSVTSAGDDDLLPPQTKLTGHAQANATPAGFVSSSESFESVAGNAAQSPDVLLPDGKGGFVASSSKTVTVKEGGQEVKLQKRDRQSSRQFRVISSSVMYGVCFVILIAVLLLMWSLFGR